MLTAKEKEIVRMARTLISCKDRWTQGKFAKTRDGRDTEFYYDNAYKFCAKGALLRAAFELRVALQRSIFRWDTADTQGSTVSGSLEEINDGPDGHRRVLALFDQALAK